MAVTVGEFLLRRLVSWGYPGDGINGTACAQAKFLLNGLYDAKMDHQPVVAIVGQQARTALGGDYQQEVDLVSLFKDVAHNQVTWELRVESGAPKLDASQVLPEFSFARYAEGLGLGGIRLERAEDIGPALREAFSAKRPVVIDALTDPEVPPLPPHIRFDQAKKLTKAFLKVDSNWRAMVREIYREIVAGWKAELRAKL